MNQSSESVIINLGLCNTSKLTGAAQVRDWILQDCEQDQE